MRPTRCAMRPTRCASPRARPVSAVVAESVASWRCWSWPAALALALSEDLRSKVLDLLFGAEDEFEYSSTTAPVEPAPASAPAA